MGDLVLLRRVATEPEALSDEALLAACATGDRAALGGLFDRFQLAVHRFVARWPGIHDASRDDVVQATFMRIPTAAAHYEGRASVKTWILGIAANAARHQRRSDRRREARHHSLSLVPAAVAEQPDATLGRQQLMASISRTLETLPHDQQVAFVMCDLEQIAGTEVARMLGIPDGTLWRRLHMARKALRAALAGARS